MEIARGFLQNCEVVVPSIPEMKFKQYLSNRISEPDVQQDQMLTDQMMMRSLVLKMLKNDFNKYFCLGGIRAE